ncbi:hypothetical protein D3H35_04895 [Cohnella faecalis]|uniref:Uncharacterized protein n=2 Tax=Cohnella faecalis TaxID=2315694 RepID=A0A398CU54_9BACL|nr:hypothetical protein D3H35_04895 [Cohnella faecalis]
MKLAVFVVLIAFLIRGNRMRDSGRRKPFRLFADWRTKRLKPEEKVEYSLLLHESGRTEEALRLLDDVVRSSSFAYAYERRAHIYNELGREEEAIADLDEAIKLNPEPYIVWYTRAIAHNDRGELEEAARDFQEALKRRDDSKASTYYELGNVYMKMNDYEKAEAAYSLSLKDTSKAIPHFYYRLAVVLEQLDRDEEALAAARSAVKLHVQFMKANDRGAAAIKERTNYSTVAVGSFIRSAKEEYGFRLYESGLLERMGKQEDALEAVEQALLEYPNNRELELRKGVLLRQLGKFEASEQLINGIKNMHPSWIPVYMELCTTYRLQEKTEEAVSVLQQAKRRFPDNTVVRYWLADAYREAGKTEEAIEENRSLLEVEPEDPLNWKQRGELAIDADLYEEADEAYSKALELVDSSEYFMRRSFVRYMADRFEDALLDIQSALKRDGSLLQESRTSYAMGELYVGMENWELAEAEYSRAIALEPDNPQIYDRRARCRYASERLPEALEDCDRGLALDPHNAKLLWLRGFISFRLDDFEAALADSLVYTRMLPDDPQGHYNIGLVYNQLDRHDDAIRAFSRTIDLNPFEAQAYLERAKLRYHYSFDRGRAADDLAQWLLYAGGEKTDNDRFALLGELSGFDDEMRDRAKEQFVSTYGIPYPATYHETGHCRGTYSNVLIKLKSIRIDWEEFTCSSRLHRTWKGTALRNTKEL